MSEKKKGSPLVSIIFIIIIIVAWGIIGNGQTKKIGTSCNIGLSKFGINMCWTWHTSTTSATKEKVTEFINGVKENINDTRDSMSTS
jgi:hypothetical protein